MATRTAALAPNAVPVPNAVLPNAALQSAVTRNAVTPSEVIPNEVRGVTPNEEGDRSVVADQSASVDRRVLARSVVLVVTQI